MDRMAAVAGEQTIKILAEPSFVVRRPAEFVGIRGVVGEFEELGRSLHHESIADLDNVSVEPDRLEPFGALDEDGTTTAGRRDPETPIGRNPLGRCVVAQFVAIALRQGDVTIQLRREDNGNDPAHENVAGRPPVVEEIKLELADVPVGVLDFDYDCFAGILRGRRKDFE